MAPFTSDQWYEFWRLGDVNLDGKIDSKDLDIIERHMGSFFPAADINEDNVVSSADLQIAASNYGLDIWSYYGVWKPPDLWVLIVGGLAAVGFFAAIAWVARKPKSP